MSTLKKQEGGNHYNDETRLQPWEIINKNGYNFYEGNTLKYLDRHRRKNGAEDIRKAIHYLEAILEFEYGEKVQ